MARMSFEERIAARQASQKPLKEGRVFEHGPATFLFVTLLVFVFVIHVGGLIVMMAMGMH
ncbi:hypothetical protein [Actinoallomurus iriomotensis]|jgi:hypothetical protein|uniref:Uncharacterized protein n=1 Tax=Actinoallomurus iriomotensis TaxID=478107 RepID=A0A9W6S107_9ACTN|nr:hypothetical protein [Actinoallomurus iriomotensis]GLY81158.1 hypothetical protein Airi01_094250 [Actinoallomurus iriomotensis]GLY86501.1 hypothetical protein Airi02_044300 [Actinoallomurus iriomotensis]